LFQVNLIAIMASESFSTHPNSFSQFHASSPSGDTRGVDSVGPEEVGAAVWKW
jgi:hypothetical protein